MTALNMSNDHNGVLHRLQTWFSNNGRHLRKKQLLEQNTELLEGQEAILRDEARPRMEPAVDYINAGEEDQMEVYGYHRSVPLTLVTWFIIILTGGLLRLFFHWFPHWWLLATHKKCTLDVAQKVLVLEKFQKKHKCYHVKEITITTREDIEKINNKQGPHISSWDTQALQALNEVNQGRCQLSTHTSGGNFKKIDSLRMFKCKKLRYVWDWDRNEFHKLHGLDKDVITSVLHQQRGLLAQEQYLRRLVFGDNEISIPVKSVAELFFLEVLNPFYVFQLCSFTLWFLDEYVSYALAILAMSSFGITMSIIQTRRNLRNLRNTVHSSDVMTVVRGSSGEVTTVPTEQLVPGDVLVVPSHGCVMHCDAVLLTGTCIVNESMLTGESVPVTKTPLPNVQTMLYDKKEHARHTLFCGTRVIQTRYFDKERVLAVVIRTGFSTSKGNLVRSILYPPPVDFKFEHDSYKFVKLLAGIASVGFVYTIVTKLMRGVSAVDITLEALDLITVVVPPALPAAMTVGRMYAQSRLEKKNIFCITPRCINVSGSVDCVCFDKTGTLTEDGMDMWGVVPVQDKHFLNPVKQVETLAADDELCRAMVTCHSLTIIDGKLCGDPLDLKMFESTNWILEEPEVDDNSKFDMIFPTIVRPSKDAFSETQNETSLEIGIVRQFPFSSSLQRMSVITRVLGANKYKVYCKGSPEMICSLSHPSSVPADFLSVLEKYTQQGYRVLAVATKTLSVSYVKVQRMQREDVESGLIFLGLVIMENRLKPETQGIIMELRDAHIRTIMVTGDNIQTATSVARDCGMIPPSCSILIVHGVPALVGQTAQVCYTQLLAGVALANGGGDSSIMTTLTNSTSLQSLATIESGSITLVEDTPTGEPAPLHNGNLKGNLPNKEFCFALTGRTWSILKTHFPDLVPRIATRGAIFARMSPDQKQQLVQELQCLGYYVAMCGDGANDCGALKAAHTGISLSEAESSVASPFTSKVPNISCVPSVIREGRAALVTSFGIFKYMAAYSLCQFVSVMILYSIDSNLTDLEYLYIDLFMITVFAFFFGRTEAFDGPLVKTPPLASLISLSPVLSLVVQVSLVIVVQTTSFLHIQQYDWFKPYDAVTQKETSVGCYENYVIFATSSFQYIILAVVFCKGPPYRKSFTSNYGMLISSIMMVALTSYLVLGPAKWIEDFFELVMPPDMSFRIMMLVYGAINFFLAAFVEIFLIDYLVFKKLRYKFHDIEKSHRKFLAVERDLSHDHTWPILSQEPPVPEVSVLYPSKQPPRSPATITEICSELPSTKQAPRQRVASTCGVTLDPVALMSVPKRRTISDSEKDHICNQIPNITEVNSTNKASVTVVNEVSSCDKNSTSTSTSRLPLADHKPALHIPDGVSTLPRPSMGTRLEAPASNNNILNGCTPRRESKTVEVHCTHEGNFNSTEDIVLELNGLPS